MERKEQEKDEPAEVESEPEEVAEEKVKQKQLFLKNLDIKTQNPKWEKSEIFLNT